MTTGLQRAAAPPAHSYVRPLLPWIIFAASWWICLMVPSKLNGDILLNSSVVSKQLRPRILCKESESGEMVLEMSRLNS